MSKLKSTIIKLSVLVFALCCSMAVVLMPKADNANAGETAIFAVEGASIRNQNDGIVGLQFVSTVNGAWLNENQADNYTFGTIIYPTENDASFDDSKTLSENIDLLDAVDIVAINEQLLPTSQTIKASIVFDREVVIDTIEVKGLEATEELVDSTLFNLYNKEFSARLYAIIDGETVYANSYSTTMIDVAVKTYELGVKENNQTYVNLALNYLGELTSKTSTVSSVNSAMVVDGVSVNENAVIYASSTLLKNNVDYTISNGNVIFSDLTSKLGKTENVYLIEKGKVTVVSVNYVDVAVKGIQVEIKDSDAVYVRTDDVSKYLTLKIVYEDDSFSSEYAVSKDNVKSIDIDQGVATVTVAVVISNVEYQDVVTIAVSEEASTVSQVLSATVGEEYMLNGIVVAFATTIDQNEVIIADKAGDKYISVVGLGNGDIYNGTYYVNGIDVGYEITVPITLKKSDAGANANKLYAEYLGGSNASISVVSKNNTIQTATDKVVIDSNDDLTELLSGDNQYKVVVLRGEMNFVVDNTYELYDFWFYDSEATEISEIAINGLTPSFSNASCYYTNGKLFNEILFGGSAASTDFNNPHNVIKEITALYLGGNQTHAQFAILSENAVVDVEATVISKDFVAPSQLIYALGDELNLYGSTITYKYDIRSSVTFDVTEDMIKNMPVIETAGNYTITVNDGLTDFTFEILVIESAVKSIEVSTMPTKSTYSHRDSFETLDLTGGSILVTYENGSTEYVDLNKEMINLEESDAWKIDTVNYALYYAGFKFTLPIVYENTALSVAEFESATIGETYDVTGVVIKPVGTGSAEFLIKDKNSNDVLSIMYSGIVGAYDNISLDTTVVNLGDEIIVKLTVGKSTSTSGNVNKIYGNATDKDTLINNLIIVSSNNNYKFDLSTATTITSQGQLTSFLGAKTERPYFEIVKLVGVKFTYYTGRYNNLYFGDLTTAAETKHDGLFVVLDRTTTIKYVPQATLNGYFSKSLSTKSLATFDSPATSTYEIYAMFTGGASQYLNFVILETDWFVKPAVAE